MLKKGFTLAEVLLTLTIIGVVAAIIMPALMTNVNDNVLEAQVKKFYSQLADAVNMYKERHDIDTLISGLNTQELAAVLMDTTPAVKADNLAENYTNINGNNSQERDDIFGEDTTLYKLRDGSVFTVRDDNTNNNWIVAADVNGLRGPNRYGVDTWTMVINENGEIRIAGNNIDAEHCLQNDLNGSCIAMFVGNNFRLRNYRNAIANGSSNNDISNTPSSRPSGGNGTLMAPVMENFGSGMQGGPR